MKYLKLFESFTQSEIDVIHNIFEQELYENIYSLKRELDKINDKKLKVGLLVDLAISKQYNVDKEEVKHILADISDDIDLDIAYDYYWEIISSDVRTRLFQFFEEEGDLAENERFIQWLQSLSDSDEKRVKDICIEVEAYEVITFMNQVRQK